MRIAYFDCFSGISGDMVVGSLIDSGLEIAILREELRKLRIDKFELTGERVKRGSITGTKFTVSATETKSHRGLADIEQIISGADFSSTVRERSLVAFRLLAEAEAAVHCTSIQKIHFHEVGATDAIVDIVGAMIGLDLLGIEEVYSSPVSVGGGFVKCEHGEIPIPAPATLKILEGVPIRDSGIRAELTTPTGAAILKATAKSFGEMPPMTVKSIGYGAGTREHSIPNLLRLMVGDASTGAGKDTVILLETNIDDMNPEYFEFIIARLFAAGALDVWITPIIMKKSRPAATLSVLAGAGDETSVMDIIFRETTTIGVRRREVDRKILQRDTIVVQTHFGKIRVKRAWLSESECKYAPEFEDCKKAAESSGQPIRIVYEEAALAARNEFKTQGIKKDPSV